MLLILNGSPLFFLRPFSFLLLRILKLSKKNIKPLTNKHAGAILRT